MKKICLYAFVLFIGFALYGCNNIAKLKGSYELVTDNLKNVYEFSSDYEILELDGASNFTMSSYYTRSNESIYTYTSEYAGELVINTEGKYFINENKVILEWFINDNKQTEEYGFDTKSIYKATYYSDGTINSKNKEYKRITETEVVNLDGTYYLYGDESDPGYFFNTSRYMKIIISGSQFQFKYASDSNSGSGNLLLGRKSGILEDFDELDDPAIVVSIENGIEIHFGRMGYFLSYAKF